MIRSSIVERLTEFAVSLGPLTYGSEWHLFGSVNRNENNASDVDLMILCQSDAQADALRQAIDTDSLALPLHLALLTYDEAASIDATDVQKSTVIFR